MNKQELTNKTQLDAKTLSAILDAANIPNNLDNYTDEHFDVIRKLQEIRKDKKVQTWPEAFAIHRKIANESQLSEIALRYSMSDRIPEIVSALKLETENVAVEQFEQFREVCEQIQQGMDLLMVAQGVLDKIKVGKAKPVMPEFAPQPDGEVVGGAIAKTDNPCEFRKV